VRRKVRAAPAPSRMRPRCIEAEDARAKAQDAEQAQSQHGMLRVAAASLVERAAFAAAAQACRSEQS
jgi:hypothetical protein